MKLPERYERLILGAGLRQSRVFDVQVVDVR